MKAARPQLAKILYVGLSLLVACGEDTLQAVQPKLVAPFSELDFGNVPVLNTRTAEIELFNAGRARVRLTEVKILQENQVFSLVSTPTEVEGGDTQKVKVSFVPKAEADYLAKLVVLSDDPELPLVEVALKGKGSTRGQIEVQPESIDFGRVGECASGLQTLTIFSKGTADLIIEEIGFTEGSSPSFAFVGSIKTPVTVKTVAANGLPGQILLTLRYSVPEGAEAEPTATIRLVSTDPDRREVLIPLKGTVNRAPTAVIGPVGNFGLGQNVSLDGSASVDNDGDAPLSYKWTLRQKPLGSNTQLGNAETATANMRLDDTISGAYEVELSVTDAAGVRSCRPARTSVVAAPAQKLLVEMFWNNVRTDMDLHVLRTPIAMVGMAPDDCHYANPRPDWGVLGDASDDPEFVRDALTGYGPEVFGYINPIEATYRVVVEYARENLAPDPETEVTVRIYQYGVIKSELKRKLAKKGDFWAVADVEWPSGNVSLVLP